MTKEQGHNGEKVVFSTNGTKTFTFKKKKINLNTDITPLTKITSKLITDLKVKCKTIKCLEDNTEENLSDSE